MKKLAAFLLASLCAAGVSAQNNYYFPTSKGTELSYKYYDRRGKVLKDDWKNVRWMKFTVEDVWAQDDGMIINVGIANETIERFAKSKTTEQVAESFSYGDVKILADSVVWDNMQWVAGVEPEYFAYMVGHGDDGPKFRVELAALTAFPCVMSVGDTLPDEKILDAKYSEILTEEMIAERKKRMEEYRIEFMHLPIKTFTPSRDVTAHSRNRKVEAFEKVETPAGMFDCYKISYELLIPNNGSIGQRMVMSTPETTTFMLDRPVNEPSFQGIKYADWISPQVGLVKREKYNDRGKVQEVMILDAITK